VVMPAGPFSGTSKKTVTRPLFANPEIRILPINGVEGLRRSFAFVGAARLRREFMAQAMNEVIRLGPPFHGGTSVRA
jgi:hypothetical protein